MQVALQRGAVACVVSREFETANVPGMFLRVENVVKALGNLAAFHRQLFKGMVIGITGSNGKTTCKEMLCHVLGSRLRGRASIRSYNNHIGVPLTLFSACADDEFLVVEIGSNAPGEVAALAALVSPETGLVTSVGSAHLEGFGGLDGVYKEKMSLFSQVRRGGTAVVNAAAVSGVGLFPRADELHWVTFGDHPEADVTVTDVSGDLYGTSCLIDGSHRLKLQVPGLHNAVNAAGVFSVCRRLGFSVEDILSSLASFVMPDMRLRVKQWGGVTIIDDSYNANPTSMRAAIDVLARSRRDGGRCVLVAGDMAELGEQSDELHRQIGMEAARAGLDVLVSVGQRARKIGEAASVESGTCQTLFYNGADDALKNLRLHLNEGDTVLIKGSRSAGLDVIAGGLD